MVFRQKITTTEYGYGDVDVYLNFAESIADLLDTTPANISEVNFIALDTLSKEMDINGGEISSEIKFKFNSYNLRENANFETFILNNTIQKFCNICFGSLTAANVGFVGVVQNEYETDDIVWNSSEWATTTSEEVEYSMTAKPYSKEIIAEYTLEELFAEIEDDTDWVATNVNNLSGYFYKYEDRVFHDIYEVRYLNLVQLDVLLRKIADELEAKITTDFSTLTIEFDDVILPMVFHPARWQLYPDGSGVTRLIPMNWYGLESVKLYDDDYYGGRLYFTDPSGNIAPLYVSSRLILAGDNEPSSTQAEKDMWTRFENFFDLLVQIAKNLGIYVSFEFTDASELTVSFKSPATFLTSNTVYLKDVNSCKLKVTSQVLEENQKDGVARSFYLANEGLEYYTRSYDSGYLYSQPPDDLPNGDLMPLSISPTMCALEAIRDDYANFKALYYEAGLPHNTGLFADATCNFGDYSTDGITSAIYIKVGAYASNPYTAYEPTGPFVSPAAAIRTNINGTDSVFYTINDYLKAKVGHNQDYYLYEREIELPYIFSFSNNSDGSSPKWDALDLGRRITLNGTDYVITDIEYDFQNWTTNIKMQTESLFAFEVPTTSATDELTASYDNFKNANINVDKKVSSGVAYDVIDKGEAVTIRSDGTFQRALADSTHAKKIIGIAMNDANAGSLVWVQKTGEATTPDSFADLTEGQLIFVRSNETTPNIDTSPLSAKSADEDLFCCVGIATTKNRYLIKITDYIFE